ncbi:MAG: DUF4199 family protein [Verrucomicrobiaceae bacterium]|nr:DUF4199 family protein [Verrucomicrobiaceae bacterium]
MKSREWKWGLLIGAVNFIWLMVSWLAGWHGGGIGAFQVAIVLGFFLSFAGFAFAFREITRAEPEITFSEGVRSGALIAALSALLTAAGWALYLGVLNPGMSAHLVAEVRAYYVSSGVAAEQIDLLVAGARDAFGLKAYTIKGGVGAFVFGILFSVILMAWNQWRARR